MICIWCEPKRRDRRFNRLVIRKPRPRKLHIESGSTPSHRFEAICGAKTPFNKRQILNPRAARREPLCKNCLRSCFGEEIAA